MTRVHGAKIATGGLELEISFKVKKEEEEIKGLTGSFLFFKKKERLNC